VQHHDVTSTTFYQWRATYGHTDVTQARQVKVLNDETSAEALAKAITDHAVLTVA
jgi:putative transposase